MRIIGGELRGRRLFSPGDRLVRPTSDRLRETIFNIVASEVQGAAVLDLFAGTGALGIEALSRGADTAWFIDLRRAALALLERNLAACGLADRSRRIRCDASRNLDCLKSAAASFNLVFIDPPYDRGLLRPALASLRRCRAPVHGARIVVEHSTSEPLGESIRGYDLEDQRRYGNTLVSFARFLL